jgi:hypothetical protein
MAKVVTPITAKVEVIGKVKQGNYGDYHSVLFADQSKPEGSEEGKIWKNFDAEDETLKLLRKGAIVQLVPAGKDKNGKEKHSIVLMGAPQTQTEPDPTEQQPVITSAVKRALAQDVETSAKFYRYCYETAQQQMKGLVDDPSELRAIATTLFLQAVK